MVGEVNAAAAPVRNDPEPMYEGRAGRTRLRSIHVPQGNGIVRSVQVYEVVNVASHPQLRESALAGTLHRFEAGEALAVPFVFHDPQARKLALVVPEPLRHEELRLRAKLLAELAEDGDSLVPAYVRDATAVVGVSGLAVYLERANGAASDADVMQREAALAARESALAQRESLLAGKDQSLAAREAAVQQLVRDREQNVSVREASFQQLDQQASQREHTLSQREQALGQREMALVQRENALVQREHANGQREGAITQREGAIVQHEAALQQRVKDIESQHAVLAQREQRLLARAEEVTRREDELRTLSEETEAAQADVAMREQELESRLEMLHQREAELAKRDHQKAPIAARDDVVAVRDDEVAEIVDDVVELEPLATSPGDDLAAAVELVEAKTPAANEADAEDDLVEDVEELDDIEPIEATGIHKDILAEDTDTRRPRTEPPPTPKRSEPPVPSVAPPPEFFERRHGSSVTAITEGDGVRMFVRLPENKDDLFTDAPPELIAQLVNVDDYPVVLLSVAEAKGARPVALRAALDMKNADDRAILENLRGRFAATIALFTAQKRYLRSFEISAPRELNAARMLDRVAKHRTAAKVDTATAIERALSAPPPVRTKDHPFGDEPKAAKNAREAATALEQLAEWGTPDKIDHALLVLAVPRDRLDATFRIVLGQAIEHGIALDARLVERAIAVGVASDASSLVQKQIESFQKTAARPDRGGMTKEGVADNWERLLKTAADLEVAIEADAHELAWKTIREVKGDGRGDVDLTKLGEAGIPELVLMLDHPRYRKAAALELCRRNDTAIAETVCKSVRKMPRAEVVRVVPQLVPLGDDIGDALIDGLSARKTFVRQAFALALGHMKLRRAVVPLLHLMTSEESDVWREVARIIGSFGNASLRAVTTQLREPKGREDRYVLCLAHLANQSGCAKQIEKLMTDERPAVATMARESLALKDQAKKSEAQVKSALAVPGEDAIIKFSRRFYQELEGKAPEHDLEDPATAEA
jgi:hypothetical protein